jgi:hypothetical protein
MIGWHTDNALSKQVLSAIPDIDLRHINDFAPTQDEHVFYGIHRGASRAIHLLKYFGIDYYYIDNGYFDALYINKEGYKSMEGKYRVVKNDMIEPCGIEGKRSSRGQRALIIPPTEYTAMHNLTTPEDWGRSVGQPLVDAGIQIRVRKKDTDIPLEDELDWCNSVISCNSMVIMRAIEAGKTVCDTHGILRNGYWGTYDIADMRAYYENKQFTIAELRDGKWI